MSNYYLCDYCGNKAGDSLFRANAVKCWKHPDNVPKKVMYDHHGKDGKRYDEPTDVCEEYEPREDKCQMEDD